MKTKKFFIKRFIVSSLLATSFIFPLYANENINTEKTVTQIVELRDPSYIIEAKIPYFSKANTMPVLDSINNDVKTLVKGLLESEISTAQANYKAYLETGGDASVTHPTYISTQYEITHYDDQTLSFVIYLGTALGSSNTTVYTFNINLEDGQAITLENLLGKNYKEEVNASIQKQMQEREKELDISYFEDFQGISDNQKFYINEFGHPVIIFDKYAIGPGYLGVQTFEINK